MTENTTKIELARKLGVTKSRVTQLCRAGLPVWTPSARYTKRLG
jgi:plasmid maintenance system antidote protein VapI